MKIEKAVCPHCGGPIEVGTRKVINCEYCGMPIVISDLDIDEKDDFVDEKSNYETPESNKNEKTRKHSYWTPVGFRTKKIWKMCVAGTLYFSLISCILMMPFGEGGSFVIPMVIFYFFAINIVFSWQPFMDHLPGLNSENSLIRIICKAAYLFADLMITAIMAGILTS